MAAKLCIIAGGGRLPGLLIEKCRETGRDFFVLALKGQADPEIIEGSPHEWVRIGNARRGFEILKEQNIEELVMAGPVRRPSLMDLRPDLRAVKFFANIGLKGVGDDGLLRALIAELEREGYRVVGLDSLLPALKAEEGPIGKHSPDEQAKADIQRGRDVLKAMSEADVGQSVVVQQGIVLGVEAVEGTDSLLQRCAPLKRNGPGGVLVKLSKQGQETRVDMATIGSDTVRRAAEAGLRGIAIGAGNTIIVDREELIETADNTGLFVVGVAPD